MLIGLLIRTTKGDGRLLVHIRTIRWFNGCWCLQFNLLTDGHRRSGDTHAQQLIDFLPAINNHGGKPRGIRLAT